MIANRVIGGNGGETASIFVTGLSETDTVTATKDGKTYSGKWVSGPNPACVVPDGYTQLDYIESTGEKYIDTLVKLTNNFEINTTITPITISGCAIFGAQENSRTRRILGINASNQFQINFNNSWVTYGTVTANTPYEVTFSQNGSNGTYSINGVTTSVSNAATDTNTNTLYLFGASGNWETSQFYKGRMSAVTIKVDDTLVRNLIPCKRTSDNAIGMYDLVTNTFFANSGTGAFVAGAEVPQTIDGFLIDNIKSYGTYTITATDGTNTATQDVLVDVATDYVVVMGYLPTDAVAEFLFDGDLNDSKNRYTFTNSGITLSDSKVYFNGNAYAIASDKIAPLGSAISISLWIKFDSSSTGQYILSQNNSGTSFNGYMLFLQSTRELNFAVWVNDSKKAILISSEIDTNWRHVCITWNGLSGGTIKLYIDGVIDKSISASGAAPTTANKNLVLGAYYESAAYKYRPNGYMDNIRFYNRELSFGEVMRLFSEAR